LKDSRLVHSVLGDYLELGVHALIILVHVVFPFVTLLMALPIITEAVPGWLAMGEQLSGQQLLVLLGLGIPVYVGLASGPGYSYYVVQDVIQRLNWRRAGDRVRIWVRLSLIGLAFASAIGFLWMVVFFGPLSICPLATTVLCVLGLKGRLQKPSLEEPG
jgi:hypothetical protein